MAQGPHIKAIQAIADDNALLLPPERAVRIRLPLTIRRVPETDPDGTLAGSATSPGEVSGYYELGLDSSLLPGLVTSRIVNATSPLRVNGGGSADLGTTNITLSINPATTTDPGSLSAADKTKIDSVEAGADATLAGAGLTKAGSTIDVVAADGSISVTTNAIAVGVISNEQHGQRGATTFVGAPLHPVASPSLLGFMSAADKTKLDDLATAIYMGANDVAGTTTVRYLNPGYNTGTAGITVVESVVIRPFTVSLLKLIFGLTGAAGATITYQLRKNGVPQTGALIAVASNAAANTVYTSSAFTTVSYAVDDTISVEITKDAGVASGHNRVVLTVRQLFV